MANNFLEKSIDLSKVDLIISFPGVEMAYMIKEAKDIQNNPTEDSHTLGDSDIKGKVWFDPYFIIALVVIIIMGALSARAASRDSQGIYSVSRK